MTKCGLLKINSLWFLVAVLASPLHASEPSETWEARFRREVPIAWAHLDRAYSTIEIEGVLVENLNSMTPQKIRYVRKGTANRAKPTA